MSETQIESEPGEAASAALRGYFTDVHPVNELDSPDWELQPAISLDGRFIYFGSKRLGKREYDAYVGIRPQAQGPFERIERLDEINTELRELSRVTSKPATDGRIKTGHPSPGLFTALLIPWQGVSC